MDRMQWIQKDLVGEIGSSERLTLWQASDHNNCAVTNAMSSLGGQQSEVLGESGKRERDTQREREGERE